MTLLTDVEAINARLTATDIDCGVNDRGQFYIERYQLTNSDAVRQDGRASSTTSTSCMLHE